MTPQSGGGTIMDNREAIIRFSGRIDSNNAAEIEREIFASLSDKTGSAVVLDAGELAYISSAGLRIILRLKKACPDLCIRDVSPEIYEIFEMTGFTEMMKVEKAYRVVSIDGCEVIGRGANGTIYRIDQDNVVKAYNNADALEDIQHEREVAKLALILGIPTAISYDVVRVGDSYGSVFELLNARSFSQILADEPERIEWCADEYVALLKKIHGTVVPEGKLPDMKEEVLSWVDVLENHIPSDALEKLRGMVKAVPKDDHMIHGDYHPKNVELQNDEVLLIDMDTLAVGHPIFELASMFNAFVGFSELDHEVVKQFQGYDFDTSSRFWNMVLERYLGTKCATKIREVEDKARILGYTRLMRRAIRRGALDTEDGKKEFEYRREKLLELLNRTDSLIFSDNEMEIEASPENLEEVQTFVGERLEALNCSVRSTMQISVAVEEIFVNIASYAYAPEKGSAVVRVEVADDPVSVIITFIDHGVPYDPLAKADPDTALPAGDREIGGLGVFMTKKLMDDVTYAYRDGQNILALRKNL